MRCLKLASRPKGRFSGGSFVKYHIFDKGIYIDLTSIIQGDDDPSKKRMIINLN